MDIRTYLCEEARRMHAGSVQDLPSTANWAQAREEWLAQYFEMMGVTSHMALAERPPLNMQITSETERDGYRIQTLYYEALPGLYVTGNLYLPTDIAKPLPGVLYVCGHGLQQKVYYQAHPRKFAQLGFACLIVETIQLGEIEGHHHGSFHRGWFNWYSQGYTPAGVELWNGVRGLDLLAALPEVDAERLGVTGISGGGAVSWWVSAADERVKVVAPVCGTATFASHVCERTIDGHCDCMFFVNAYGWELADVARLIAPRPMLIGSANRDGIFHIKAIREAFAGTKNIYDHLNAGDNVRLIETPGGHSYHANSRRGIFSWFKRHLEQEEIAPEDVGDIDDSPELQEDAATLRVYRNGIPPAERVSTIQEDFFTLPELPDIATPEQLATVRKQALQGLKETSFRHFPATPCDLDAEVEYEIGRGDAVAGGRFAFTSESAWRLHGAWTLPESELDSPAVLALRAPHEQRKATEEWLQGFETSWARIVAEPRGCGDTAWGPELDWNVRRSAMLTGRTIASMQVYDTLRALEAVGHLPGVDGSRIVLAGRGQMAVVALYAALLHGGVEALILSDLPESLSAPSNPDGTGIASEILFALQHADLPQAAGLLWPMELVFLGPRPGTFGWTEDLYHRLGTPGAIRHVMSLGQWQPGTKG
jgi:cephalosporin-C deacetylase-like acetyl esterase